MSNLEILKQELINQKKEIENRSGFVSVAHDYPSPFEITEGIKSIPSSDLSMSTATESDVVQGKTFFSGNSELKMGTAIFDPKITNSLFMYNDDTVDFEGEIFYAMPEGAKSVRKYCFSRNAHTIKFSFNKDITKIDEYAFSYATNMEFEGFHEINNLSTIASYAFYSGSTQGIDFGRLPNTIKTMGSYIFCNSIKDTFDYRFPDSLESLSQAVFRQDKRTMANSLDLTNYTRIKTLPAYTFYYIAFNDDFSVPSQVNTIGSYFNYNGCFRNVYIHSGITNLQQHCFSCNDSTPASDYYLRTVTFESEVPPATIGIKIFGTHHINNGFKIYVPDNSVEEYKSALNLNYYESCIYPMSQKE